MGMSKTLYLIPVKTQFALKLQMQDHTISYFFSLKLTPEGECMVQAICLNESLPVHSLYLYSLLRTFSLYLLNLYRSVMFSSSKNEKAEILMGKQTPDSPWHSKMHLRVQPSAPGSPPQGQPKDNDTALVLKPLEMLCVTRVHKTSLKEAEDLPTAKRASERLRVEVSTCS